MQWWFDSESSVEYTLTLHKRAWHIFPPGHVTDNLSGQDKLARYWGLHRRWGAARGTGSLIYMRQLAGHAD